MQPIFVVLFICSLFCDSNGLTFSNVACVNKGKSAPCPMQAKGISFNKYELAVDAVNNADYDIPGGEVTMNVQIKIIFWVNAYSGTDPTCSFTGTDCTDEGVLIASKQQKTLKLVIGDQTPPSGTYKGTAKFYYLDPRDTSDVFYASVSMNWQCDDSKCY